MPVFDFKCKKCGKLQEHLVTNTEPVPLCSNTLLYLGHSDLDTTVRTTEVCMGKLKQLISGFGGYQGNTGPASTRPKNAGSFRRK